MPTTLGEKLCCEQCEKKIRQFERPHKIDGESAEGVKVELISISSAYIRNIFSLLPPEIATVTLRKKCPCSEFFWSAFFCIRTEYGEIRSVSVEGLSPEEDVKVIV